MRKQMAFRSAVFLGLTLLVAACGGSSDSDRIMPRQYGLFAVDDDGDLQRLDGDREWEVQTWGERSDLAPDVEFVVFDRSLAANNQPLSNLVRLYRVAGVRNEIQANGSLSKVTGNRWATVARKEFQVPLRFGPVEGRADAVRAAPVRPLEPGLYSLQLTGEAAETNARIGVAWNSVNQPLYAEANCVDRILGEKTQYRLCSEEPAGAGLRIDNVRSRRYLSTIGEVLSVEGQVINVSDRPRRVPPLVANLEDSSGRRVREWTLQSQIVELAPGESAPFRDIVEQPPLDASRVNIGFSPQ